MTDDAGVDARQRLDQGADRPFTPTDPARLDGYVNHISCTIEYPNLWYLDQAVQRDRVFREWVLLFLEPHYLWNAGTGFCPYNASRHAGRDVSQGFEAFKSMFASAVTGSGGVRRERSATHLSASPTDDQAEVLVRGPVPLVDIQAIAVASDGAAEDLAERMTLLGLPDGMVKIVIAPVLFSKYALRAEIVAGRRPSERVWTRVS
jgi:hypothetical protein